MKWVNLLSWSLLFISSFALAESDSKHKHQQRRHDSNVYLLSNGKVVSNDDTTLLTKHEAMTYLDTFLELDEPYVKLGDNDQLIDLLNGLWDTKKLGSPKLIVNVKGEDLDAKPMFKTKHLPLHKLMKNLVTNVPSVQLYKLTPELKYVTTTDNEVDSSSLVHHFNYFTEKLDSIWKQFNAKHQQEIQLYTPTNDKLFINELSQLIHLGEKINHTTGKSTDVFFFEVSSLLSIKRKIGSSSTTFIHAKEAMTDLLLKLSQTFDIIVVTFPQIQELSHLNKRNVELSVKSFQYGTQAACEVATNKCNSHGKCTQVGDNWACQCEPSFNKTTSKTTTWVGHDCSKKDVSVEANLFLWTSIALVVILVGGIQLMFGIGNDPLPGVLDAATIPKKSNL